MQTLKQEAIELIANLPEPVKIEDIMYHLYVLEKIKKGREAIKKGEYTLVENLKIEIELWHS
ncbi:MAG: hypothetical protein PHC92_11565 [Syntrophomonadaceae bacterium]|nr:hypothetical protein [Syntrophomonadaceae bacterium]MDD3024362.1 hypothetical protein [Syntrophomonadaceae bacterium]